MTMDILLVEDNPGDVRLTQEIFKECSVRNMLHVAKDGEEAMAFLKREGPHANIQHPPQLIILDLNLPKKGGREVLTEIKNDPDLRRIPVIIFTSSRAEGDIIQAYNLHANCYILKPVDLDQFMKVAQSLRNFWLGIATLPEK